MGEYIPAAYLTAASSLTDEQLRRCYQDFTRSLEYAATAPTLVFERLVANIAECLKDVATDTPSEARAPAAPPSCSPPPPPPPLSLPLRLQGGGSSNTGTTNSHVAKFPRQPATGTFHTGEILPSYNMGCSKLITFSRPYTSPPRIVTGLRWLSISPSGALFNQGFNTLHATSSARATTRSDFAISVSSDDFSRLGTCASWLSVPPEDTDFQVGTFSTTEDHPSDEQKREVSRRIVFERAYEQPPQVAVWFSGFQYHTGGSPSMGTWCDDVTATGFLLFVSSPEESTPFSAEVAWAACSHDRPNTCMGTFSTSSPFRGESGFRGFGGGNDSFKEESTSVFLATNSIAVNTGHDWSLRISCLKVDKSGLSWSISTRDSPWVTHVGAAFIVLG